MKTETSENEIINNDMDKLLESAEILIENAIVKVNMEKINLYWNMGKLVNDYKIKNSSKYGDGVVKGFCEILSTKYGDGYSRRNINKMCLFNAVFEIGYPGTQSSNLWLYASKYKKATCLVAYS